MADLIEQLRECCRDSQDREMKDFAEPWGCEVGLLRQAATELEALRKRCEAVEFELDCLRTQYEERTAYTIVHRGAALCCSSAMRDAYSDEHHRAERLAKALNIAHRHIDMAALRISHAKDAEAIAAAQEPSHG